MSTGGWCTSRNAQPAACHHDTPADQCSEQQKDTNAYAQTAHWMPTCCTVNMLSLAEQRRPWLAHRQYRIFTLLRIQCHEESPMRCRTAGCREACSASVPSASPCVHNMPQQHLQSRLSRSHGKLWGPSIHPWPWHQLPLTTPSRPLHSAPRTVRDSAGAIRSN